MIVNNNIFKKSMFPTWDSQAGYTINVFMTASKTATEDLRLQTGKYGVKRS